MQTRYRTLARADAALRPGEAIRARGGLATTADPGKATGGFAAEQVLVLLLVDADVAPDGSVRGGVALRVVGERRLPHHLPSAVDIEIVALAVASDSVAEEEAEAAFAGAMMRVSLALAGGAADGTEIPAEYAGSILS